MIRRRHVFYVEGYDPRGADGFYRLFQREWKRFLSTWPIAAELGALAIDSEDLAHWDIDARGPNWQVSTRYEFLRLEPMLRANLDQPLWRQVPRALRWMLDDLLTGTLRRIFRASWRFGLHLVYPQLLLLVWIAIAVAGGWLAAYAAMRLAGLPGIAALVVAVAAAAAIFAALRPLADRWFVLLVTNGWPYLREFARGAATGYDRSNELLATRIVAAAGAGEADEILVVGHSSGGVTAPAILARALELDPGLGCRGPSIVLMTVGSLMPAFALHPAAVPLRGAVRRLAVEPSVRWIDCQSRKDVMNFWNFDPVGGVGIDAGGERCNPLVWPVRLRDMLSEAVYRRLRRSFFRMHYQYIMGNDRRAPYDYFMLVCGPAAIADLAGRRDALLAAFSPQAAYLDAPLAALGAATGSPRRRAPND